MILLPVLCPNLVGIFLVLPFYLTLPAPAQPGILAFIISTPQSNASMIAQTFHIVHRLLMDIIEQGAFCWIHAAGKHKVLPNHNSMLITQIIEDIVLIDTSTPDAQHIHVYTGGIENRPFIILGSDARQEVIRRDVIGSFGKNRTPVQLYIESMPVLIRLMHHLQRAYAHPFGFRVQQFPTCNDIRTETIKKRLPQSITPPQLRLVKDKINGHPIGASLQIRLPLAKHSSSNLIRYRDQHSIHILIGIQLHMSGNHGPACTDFLLLDKHIVDSQIAPSPDIHRTPDAGGNQTWAPIPAIMITRLTGKNAYLLVEQAPVFRLVIGCRILVGKCIPFGDVYLYRRMEVHLQYIILLPDVLPNGDRPAAKHIVRFQYTFIIQINVSVSIQPLEHKLHILFPHHVGSKSKASFINPVFLVNPL